MPRLNSLLSASLLLLAFGCGDKPGSRTKAQVSGSSSPTAPAPEAAPDPLTGEWHAELDSPGGALGFAVHFSREGEGYRAEVENGPERLPFTTVELDGEALLLRFDGYDSEIRADIEGDQMRGTWTKTAPKGSSSLDFSAVQAPSARLGCTPLSAGGPASVAGSWSLRFEDESGSYVGRAELEHEAGTTELGGTILTDTGDYRYLAGCYVGGSLGLSVFDGAHAFLLRAEVGAEGTLRGDFWSRDSYHASFTGARIESDQPDPLADPWRSQTLVDPAGRFEFAFPDLDGALVRHDDPRFAAKVVIVDIFGTWCPNCNDQAPLLGEWQRRYGERGLEIVGLAYEFTGDPKRDAEYVRKFAARHRLDYTLLLAGTSDKQDAAATLSGFERLISYPTTVFVGRDGRVRKIYSGYFGPATGERHEAMVREHEALIETLLAEGPPGQ